MDSLGNPQAPIHEHPAHGIGAAFRGKWVDLSFPPDLGKGRAQIPNIQGGIVERGALFT
jgi:hypothetical protein